MEKRCFSIKTAEFEKCLKTLGKAKVEKLLERMKKLEDMENDFSLIPNGVRTPELAFGKTLSQLNKNIYALEFGTDRALAVITQKEGKKVYVWFWNGSHEDYNNKLKMKALNEQENRVEAQGKVISNQIKELSKESVIEKIKESRKPENGYDWKAENKKYMI